jgi:hypothetical protein
MNVEDGIERKEIKKRCFDVDQCTVFLESTLLASVSLLTNLSLTGLQSMFG